jgi:hypothetical protein
MRTLNGMHAPNNLVRHEHLKHDIGRQRGVLGLSAIADLSSQACGDAAPRCRANGPRLGLAAAMRRADGFCTTVGEPNAPRTQISTSAPIIAESEQGRPGFVQGVLVGGENYCKRSLALTGKSNILICDAQRVRVRPLSGFTRYLSSSDTLQAGPSRCSLHICGLPLLYLLEPWLLYYSRA